MAAHVTLREIADRAGVSTATVSLALRGNPRISPATRTRLTELAASMGYQAHPYISAYMSWRKQGGALIKPSIALLHDYGPEGWREHSSFNIREMRRGALEQIKLRGYVAQEIWIGSMSPKRLLQVLRTRGVRGLVFAPIQEKAVRYDFPWAEFSAVQIGTSPAGLNLPRVAHNHYQSALDAARHCVAQGYRRPGLIFDPAHDERLQHMWHAGFEMGIEESKLTRNRVLRLTEKNPDHRALTTWLKCERPDVVITNLHEWAENLLRNQGFTVPRQIGLVSLSVPAPGHRVTGVHQDTPLIGAQAVDLLAGALQLNRTGVLPTPIVTLVGGRWNPGETL